MAINNNAIKISQKHLLGIQDLSISDVKLILDEAKKFISLNKSKNKKLDILRGKTQINLFFEPSTRTQSSFELAGKRLGAACVGCSRLPSPAFRTEQFTFCERRFDAPLS